MNKDGIRWLSILELESRRGDWVRSTNQYSINRIMDKLSINGPSEKNLPLGVWDPENPDIIIVWVKAKLINGAWMFTIIEEEDVLV